MGELSEDLAAEIQQAWQRFLQRTESLRPDLHRFCRALTGSVWDAEDLVQDTLLRSFAKLGEFQNRIDNPRAYLFRIASNLWIDHFRRADPHRLQVSAAESISDLPDPDRGNVQSAEVRDAASQILQILPPQERAAVILKDVFEFRAEEIAEMLGTTAGAIKSALHRGREKLAAPRPSRPAAPPSTALLDRFVDAFNARDVERLAALLREDATAEVISVGTSRGRNRIRDSEIYYSLFLEKGEPQAERYVYDGEPIVVIWYPDPEDAAARAVRDVLRFEEAEGRLSRMRFYSFCVETEAEILDALGLRFASFGYGPWTPEFLGAQKQEEFQAWMAERAK
ncbi:MAG TPA: sigma-70 family RNA polymerase sigma factor [Blastocatellia bacterium]|nr:sigma-70 family RNA polymerase sigma factor [Blastocatellia bacterium]